MFVATIFLLAVVVDLVLLEFSHKVINHFDHLLKADLLAVQSHGNEVQLDTTLAMMTKAVDDVRCTSLGGLLRNLDLNKAAGAWEGLLEELKSIIIIEDFDSVSQGCQLLHRFDHLLKADLLAVMETKSNWTRRWP